MPKITPARPNTHAPRAESLASVAAASALGWCLLCYEAGEFTLSADPDGAVCRFHGALSGPESPPALPEGRTFAQVAASRSRRPRGRAARPVAPADRPPPRARVLRRDVARRVARAMAYGRRRAATRLQDGSYSPRPGWRHMLAEGWRVVVEQPEALDLVAELVAEQGWRADKRAAWSAILRHLVCAMDWETGLIAAVTAQRLGDAGDRAPRTVSRVIAWARDVGLLVVVEHGASAEFLATDHGRTPTYAIVSTRLAPQPPEFEPPDTDLVVKSAQLTDSSPLLGDLPLFTGHLQPLNKKRHEHPTRSEPTWPGWRIPGSPNERVAATRCLLTTLGLDDRGLSGVPLWRAARQLHCWWEAGASPRGLAWAIEHHPDQPDRHRGDALRGARNPLAVLGARLSPWRHRLHKLPAARVGHRTLTDAHEAEQPTPVPTRPSAAPPSLGAAGQQARAHIARVLAAHRSLHR